MNSLDSLDLSRATREKGKPAAQKAAQKGKRESPPGSKGKGKRPSMCFELHFHLAILSRARTHDTKRFPGYGGACLKANSLPPTSDGTAGDDIIRR